MLREAGTLRIVATMLLLFIALIIARYSWDMRFVNEIERVLFDVRATQAMDQVEQDERIAIIVYDENTLFDTGVRSPLDRDILARALTNIDAMEPRAIGIDILIDQPTANDAQLAEALRGLETPTYLAYVSLEHNPDEIQPRQMEYMQAFFDRVDTENIAFASVHFETDEDNVNRAWPEQPADLPPLLPNAMAPGYETYRNYGGSITYRTPLYSDGEVFLQLPIDFFADPEMAPMMADQIRGRYVLIGTDLADRDQFETPFSRVRGSGTVPGVEIHAHLLAQMLDGVMLNRMQPWMLWALALLVVLLGALTSLSDLRLWKLGLLIIVQAAFVVVMPFLFHNWGMDTQTLPVFGWVAGWVIAFMAVGAAARSVGAEKRQFVTGALGKYLPGDVARQLLNDPDRLALHGEKREIYALFTDLQGFTKLSHAIEPEMVARLLNTYLDMLSKTVLEHGGTLDKFVGDAIVAFWGAPISRPDDKERAAQCAVACFRIGEQFRAESPPGAPPIGETRVGLHRGEAIVGNFGGQNRMQYTALGDAMNTAARLESANKQTGSTILVSKEATEGVETVDFRPLGRVTLSGRSTPVEIYEPVLDVTTGSREKLHELWRRFEDGDSEALAEIEALARDDPGDEALRNMAERLHETEPGGSYVLQGK